MDFHITTYQTPSTFDEACVQVRELDEKADACLKLIYEQGKDLIEQGKEEVSLKKDQLTAAYKAGKKAYGNGTKEKVSA